MSAAVIGREEELGSIQAFLEEVRSRPGALVLSGEPGIGKTILFDAGVQRAGLIFDRVLTFRGVEAEARLSFAALADLLTDVLEEALPALGGPRRRALEIALLLEEPGDERLDSRAVALAFLDVVRALAASGSVLVAVDDLQWLDASSSRVLLAALRRLREEPVGLLATARVARDAPLPFALERSLPEAMLERLLLEPLSLGVLHRLLKERLGLDLARPELVRLDEVTGGNPFFALEIGRELASARARLAPGRPLPVPGNLRKLLGGRLARLHPDTQDVLLSVSALAEPTVEVLAAAHGDHERTVKALEEAKHAGVIELDESRLRFSHPLLASVCYEETPLWRRRAAHRRLAGPVAEAEERARHLALAADGPDAGVALELDQAAEQAAARGATAAAADLSELASELTPPVSDEERRRRRLAAANFHRLAGDRERAASILDQLLPDAQGDERADVMLALARSRREAVGRSLELCEAASRATSDDARVAEALAFLSFLRILDGDVYGSLAAARAGLERAERVGDPELLSRAIGRVGSAEQFTLDITPGLLERGVVLEQGLPRQLEYPESPIVAFGRRLILLGELDKAREIISHEEEKAAARGDEGTRGQLLFYLIMLEWQAGRWRRGLEHAAAALELAEQLGDEQYKGMVLYGRATVLAHLGDVDEARLVAAEALTIAETTGDAEFPIWNSSLLGFIELSLGNMRAAARHLRPLPRQLVAQGWNEPGDPWPEAIETLLAVGELDEARSLLALFEERAHRLGVPRGLAPFARCRALLAAAEGDLETAYGWFERALAEHDRAEVPFECGRTLFAFGATQRRAKRQRAARESLERAAAVFEELGARLWAAKARAELARIGGRRPASTALTQTEQRVASLAADGLSNKEIASTLFVSVHTVEAHLSRIYRKLEIRSRAELGRRIDLAKEAIGTGAAAKA
jgi:DNA-binding CsgD family transcriptional regulator